MITWEYHVEQQKNFLPPPGISFLKVIPVGFDGNALASLLPAFSR